MTGSRARRPRAGPLFAVVVAALTLVAWRDPNHVQRATEVASIVLTLPTFVPLLPVVYAGLAASRNLLHADTGGTAWPVTIVYVAMFTGLAVLEVVVVRRVRAGRRARRDRGRQRRPSDRPWPPAPSTAPGEHR